MVNNPFRGKPSSKPETSIQEWGKVKFKPTKFGNGNKNPHGKGNNGYNRKFDKRLGNFNKNKDSCKFNQVAKDAKPENATPWNKYKDEIIFKQREDEQAALQANMVSEEAKKALKQREINYRKLLIEQKKQEPTKWENFADEDDATTSKKEDKKNYKSMKETKNTKSFSKSKKDFKNSSDFNDKPSNNEIIPQELLNNFDSKKLTFEQNDKLRKIITKTTTLAKGCSLKMAIQDMKRKREKKIKGHSKDS